MRARTTALTAYAVLLAPALVGAQGWRPIGTPDNSNTGAYWNNTCDDNVGSATCNAGAILTNTPALTPTSCANLTPPGTLPLAPAPLGTGNVFFGSSTGGALLGGFRFGAGTFAFRELRRVAGATTTQWGILTDAGQLFTADALMAATVQISTPFAIWIEQARPLAGAGDLYTSAMTTGSGSIGSRTLTINQQFAVFTATYGVGNSGLGTDAFGTIIRSTGEVHYFVGMEDNVNGGRGFEAGQRPGATVSDRDYNDIVIEVFTTPEPSGAMLTGVGLVAGLLVAAARRACTTGNSAERASVGH